MRVKLHMKYVNIFIFWVSKIDDLEDGMMEFLYWRIEDARKNKKEYLKIALSGWKSIKQLNPILTRLNAEKTLCYPYTDRIGELTDVL